jgi:Zn-dependent peptidase ImmA (M78 family)
MQKSKVDTNSLDYWEERANKVLTNFSFMHPDEIDMYEIIRRYGMIIKPLDPNYFEGDYDSSLKAFSIPKEKGRRGLIYLNPELDPIEKKLILAEEFCHLYAHYHNQLFESKLIINKAEEQARRMSAYLLMPWIYFKRVFNDAMDQSVLVTEVADYFLVPEDFAHYRLELHFKHRVDGFAFVKGKMRTFEIF